jgi:hypothetical protein
VSGSATPKDLETALQLNYLVHTAPNMTPEVLDLLKRRLAGALQNRDQNPRAVFGERVGQINSSNHYSASELTPADVPTLGKESSAARDTGVRFPTTVIKEEVRKGKEPASQTVLTFFADPGFDEYEMHRARAAAGVLNIRLREILREEMGGTYGVGVGFSNTPAVRQRPGERRQDGGRHARGNRAAQERRAVQRRCRQGEGAGAPRPRDQRQAERLLARLAADGAYVRLGSHRYRTPFGADGEADAGDPEDDVPEVLPDGSLHAGDVEAGVRTGQRGQQGQQGRQGERDQRGHRVSKDAL